ncbi:MAG: nucleotidyltransferase [Chloroflexi bacterium]|nr:nucleotidyltransferase [Chloroflexota bacterium]
MNPAVPTTEAEHFYARALEHLVGSGVPFMVGGAYAMREYAGIFRWTKDLDVFCKAEDYPCILQVLAEAGCTTEITDTTWLVKGFCGDLLVDVIFNSGNGLCPVDESWLERAPRANVLGYMAKLVPPEEMIWSKVYIQERERFDGADVLHIIRQQGARLDWQRLLARLDSDWEVLLAHLVNFRFAYPSERDVVPRWLMEELLSRVDRQLNTRPPTARICRGPLLSRTQYEADITGWGYQDVRPLRLRGVHGQEERERGETPHRRARRPARSRDVERDVPRAAGRHLREG